MIAGQIFLDRTTGYEETSKLTVSFNSWPHNPDFLTTLRKKTFENIVGKGENAGNQHFLLFPQCFLPIQRRKSSLELHLFCRLQMLSIWTVLEFCPLVDEKADQWQTLMDITLLVPFLNNPV